jgi:IS30 family transposase
VNRPEKINERKIPGHREGDLIVGAYYQSCVGTLVERTTGYLLLCKMRSKSAADVRQGFENKLQDLPDCLRRSMTYDRGAEMAEHALMTKELKMSIYFADPHAPWQHGSNENTTDYCGSTCRKGRTCQSLARSSLIISPGY